MRTSCDSFISRHKAGRISVKFGVLFVVAGITLSEFKKFVISTDGGVVVRVPMKPRRVPKCAVEFSRSVNYFERVFSGVFQNDQSLI